MDTQLNGDAIATVLGRHYASLWEEILGTRGPLRYYYDNEWSYESDFYTSLYRLVLIGASREFNLGTVNEVSKTNAANGLPKIDVVWVSKLPAPIPKFGINTRTIDANNILLLAEIE